jgi:hypothetical protein
MFCCVAFILPKALDKGIHTLEKSVSKYKALNGTCYAHLFSVQHDQASDRWMTTYLHVKGVMALYNACTCSKSSPTVTKTGMAPSAVPNNRLMVTTRR